jgi:hypothetical protein
MENMKEYSIRPLSKRESREINGGVFGLLAFVVGAVYLAGEMAEELGESVGEAVRDRNTN